MTALAKKQVKKELKQIQSERKKEQLKTEPKVPKKLQQLRSLVRYRNDKVRMATIKELAEKEDESNRDIPNPFNFSIETPGEEPVYIKAA
jgi:hypothetical protein